VRLASVPLEDWLREYYFRVEHDLGSSGVEPYTLGEVRALASIAEADLDRVLLEDSDTFGAAGLRAALAARFGTAEDRVMVTHGSSEAIYATMRALLEAGDEAIAPSPGYPQLTTVAEACGATVRRWIVPVEAGARPDLDALEALVTPRTRAIVANFPHNPTGVALTGAERERLIAIARRCGAHLVWDTAYAELDYEPSPGPDPMHAHERTIVFGTLSKAYGLPGLRVGWCIAAPETLRRMVGVRDHTTLYVSPLIEAIAERVIRHGDAFVAPRRECARANRALVGAWVRDLGDLVAWRLPEGGVCAFPALPRVADVTAFCRALAENQKVLLVPGACFERPRHVRLGFGCSTATLERGLERVTAALRRAAA